MALTTSAGVLLALASAASWALGATLYQRLGEVSAFGLNLVSTVLGVLLLLPLVLHAPGPLPGNDALLELAVSGVLGIAVGDTLFFLALQRLGAHAVVVLSMLAPVVTVLLSLLLLGERPAPSAWVGAGAVLAGVSVVLGRRLLAPAEGRSEPLGLLYGGGAVLVMALGTVAAKHGVAASDATSATLVRMAAGAAALALGGALGGRLRGWTMPLLRGPRLSSLLVAVVVVTFGGFWCLHAAMQRVDLVLAASVHATEPLFVLPLAWWMLGERPSVSAWLGTALAVGGVVTLFAAS
ncbi:MAG: hypothetical protein RIT45_1752 [Pseudomonadota bacterium]